jgi:transposase-like protein
MKRYSFEEKKAVALAYLKGESTDSICRRFHVGVHSVYLWSSWYEEYGDAGLNDSISKRHSSIPKELKLEILTEYETNSLSLTRISTKYGICRSTLAKWHRLYKIGGTELLLAEKRRGCPPRDMGRPKKRETQTEIEKLRERLEYLEAENALLKKVRALVEAREARLKGTGQEPSTN